MNFEAAEFEWDDGNQYKSLLKHGVSNDEAESAFFDEEGLVYKTWDGRYVLLGKSSAGRYLFQAFEIRNKRIRIISSRPMTQKEKRHYRGR